MTKEQKDMLNVLRTFCAVLMTGVALSGITMQLADRFRQTPLPGSEPNPPTPIPTHVTLPECNASYRRILEAVDQSAENEGGGGSVSLYLHGNDGRTARCTLSDLNNPIAYTHLVNCLSAAGFRAEWNANRSILMIQDEKEKLSCLLFRTDSPVVSLVQTSNPYQFDVWHKEFKQGENPLLGPARSEIQEIRFRSSNLLTPTRQAQILAAAFHGVATGFKPEKVSLNADGIRVDLMLHRPLSPIFEQTDFLAQR